MDEPDPEISIIIACYNAGRQLLETIESCESCQRAQQCAVETIIVNDGSTDGLTLQLLSEIERRGYRVLSQTNQGPASARNAGIRAARGRYILPLDADNRLRAAYLHHGVSTLNENPSIDVVYGDLEYFGDRNGRRFVPEFELDRIVLGNYIDTCAVFRKSLWERLGGYDENGAVRGLEDWDFWIRAGFAGAGFRHVAEVLFDYRVQSGSLTSFAKHPTVAAATEQYLRNKQVNITLGTYIDGVNSWKPVIYHLRGKPLHAVWNLFRCAFLNRAREYVRQRWSIRFE